MRNVLIAAAALLALAGPAHAGDDADSILDPHGTFRAEQQMAHDAYQREMEREEAMKMAGRISGRSTTTTTRASDRASPSDGARDCRPGSSRGYSVAHGDSRGGFRPALPRPPDDRAPGLLFGRGEAALKVGRHG